MNPNQIIKTEQPNVDPENIAGQEVVQNNEVLISQNIVAENLPQDNISTQAVNQVSTTLADTDDVEPTEAEIKEEFSEEVQTSDKPWVQKVGDVIKDLSDQPYQEEEAAEDLQISYMSQRFGVEIDKKDHKI